MNLSRFLLPALFSTGVILADDLPGALEKAALSHDQGSGAFNYSWWGVDGRTYFIEHTHELGMPTAWTFLPVIESGKEQQIDYGLWLEPLPPRFFLRLRYTDQATGGDAYTADFDGDGIPNGWEIEHGLNPFNAPDAALINGGLTNLEIYQQSLGEGADPATINSVGLMIFTP